MVHDNQEAFLLNFNANFEDRPNFSSRIYGKFSAGETVNPFCRSTTPCVRCLIAWSLWSDGQAHVHHRPGYQTCRRLSCLTGWFGSKIHSFVSSQNQQFPTKEMGWFPNLETHPFGHGCYKLPLFLEVFLLLLLYDWSAGLGLYLRDPFQIPKARATMDVNKIPLNRWTWWNMSICLYVCINIYIYTHASTIIWTKSIYSISIYFFDIWEPKAFIYTFTQTSPFGLTIRIHHSLLLFATQATGSPRKSNWPRGHQQRKPTLPPDPKLEDFCWWNFCEGTRHQDAILNIFQLIPTFGGLYLQQKHGILQCSNDSFESRWSRCTGILTNSSLMLECYSSKTQSWPIPCPKNMQKTTCRAAFWARKQASDIRNWPFWGRFTWFTRFTDGVFCFFDLRIHAGSTKGGASSDHRSLIIIFADHQDHPIIPVIHKDTNGKAYVKENHETCKKSIHVTIEAAFLCYQESWYQFALSLKVQSTFWNNFFCPSQICWK